MADLVGFASALWLNQVTNTGMELVESAVVGVVVVFSKATRERGSKRGRGKRARSSVVVVSKLLLIIAQSFYYQLVVVVVVMHLPASQLEPVLPFNIGRFLERGLKIAHTNSLTFVLGIDTITMLQIGIANLRLRLAKLTNSIQTTVGEHDKQMTLRFSHATVRIVCQARFCLDKNLALTIYLTVCYWMRVCVLSEYSY